MNLLLLPIPFYGDLLCLHNETKSVIKKSNKTFFILGTKLAPSERKSFAFRILLPYALFLEHNALCFKTTLKRLEKF